MADPLLVIGILPAEGSARAARARSNMENARRFWVAAAPPDVLTRFVVRAETAVGKPLRRRLALPGRRQQERRRQAHRRLEHGDDVVSLATPDGSACGCAELLRAWFAHALVHWPAAHFIGKTEDDVTISLHALRFELTRLAADRMLWWGLMAWTGNGDIEHPRVGCWGGGFEDDPVLSAKGIKNTLAKERACPDGARPIAPSPTHEVDIRSVPLARAMSECTYPRRWLDAMSASGRRCPNDCAGVQGLWLTRCVANANVTLAHATWSKVHSNSLDAGWRPFAPPSNLTIALDMNLGDKKLKALASESSTSAPWERAAATMAVTRASAFPPLLYAYDPSRAAGEPRLLAPLNPRIAALHHGSCRWGGCHPSRSDGYVEWPAWQTSLAWPATSASALGI